MKAANAAYVYIVFVFLFKKLLIRMSMTYLSDLYIHINLQILAWINLECNLSHNIII